MTLYYAQSTLITQDGNPENYQSNVFALGGIGSLDLTGANTWTGYIKDFYDDCYEAGALRGIAINNHVVKIYEVLAGPPNYPVYETNFNLGYTAGATDLPQEVSLCVSYYAAQATTIPRARRRGRIYISGWTEGANGQGRPTTTAVDDLLDAMTTYVTACDSLTNLYAGVWSRSNDAVYEIDTVWVDNEWDTQRRRGGKPTTRTEWTKP